MLPRLRRLWPCSAPTRRAREAGVVALAGSEPAPLVLLDDSAATT
jgi:hypothetical protein